MKKYTLYVGLNDKDTKMQKIDTLEGYKVAMNVIKNYTSGATIFSATGIYTHDDGTIITENTLRIELMFIDKPKVVELVNVLKLTFNQESIVMQVQNIESELI